MPLLFAATLFTSAALLFLVEPMMAKWLLPLLGGSPAVWNTCMLFYQAALLAGYAYAHLLATRLGTRLQAAVHVGLLALGLLALPLAFPAESAATVPHDANPIRWLLATLAVTIGLPFLAASATAPLLQKWFAATGHAAAPDPYFLYGASNLGSMAALLAYPFVVEPALELPRQGVLWSAGYVALVGLTAVCAVVAWRAAPPAAARAPTDPSGAASPPPPTWPRRARWVGLAFVPSSLMLGTTTYLSTDIAAIPLLWVVPLALYLLSFIIVFSRRVRLPYPVLGRALGLSVLLATIVLVSEQEPDPSWLLILIHLTMLFLAALVCHGTLAGERPPTRYLSEYYLWLALGGVLGGVFNGLLAPVLFDRLAEFPLMTVAVGLCLPTAAPDAGKAASRLWDLALPAGLGALTAGLMLSTPRLEPELGRYATLLMLAVPAFLCYLFVRHPLRFALGVAALQAAGSVHGSWLGRPIYRDRSFFGALRVTIKDEKFHQLVHGNTLHGRQRWTGNPARRREPLAYYYPTGPVGDVFESFNRLRPQGRVAVIGLGAGGLTGYARRGQAWTYYEIDPAVKRVAEDPRFFTFLADSPAPVAVELGDARLRLAEATDGAYDLLILDAFNSDAIPVHLLTREAMALYAAKLAPDGMMAFHISNRYLDLKPLVANLAHQAGFRAWARDDLEEPTEAEQAAGKVPSQWALLARDAAHLGELEHYWPTLPPRPRGPLWTDHFSNVLSVFRWR